MDSASCAAVRPSIDRLTSVTREQRLNLLEDLYANLVECSIRYVLPEYQPSDVLQTIRPSHEILATSREGTCLDLALLFCGVAMSNDLLPMLVVLEEHALVMVSLDHDLSEWDAYDRRERNLFAENVLTDPAPLVEMLNSGSWTAIECTGFASSQFLQNNGDPDLPEASMRVDGFIPFKSALEAGKSQLLRSRRKFEFALDVATAHFAWKIEPLPPPDDSVRRSFFDYLRAVKETPTTAYRSLHLTQGLELKSVYVEPRVIERGQELETPEEGGKAPREIIGLEPQSDVNLQIAIVGGPGSGKSTTLRMLASEIASATLERRHAAAKWIPMFVRLQTLGLDEAGSLEERLWRAASIASDIVLERSPSAGFLQDWPSLEGGKWLLLLDGLDEVDPRDLNKMRIFIGTLLGRGYDIVVSSRGSAVLLDWLDESGFKIAILQFGGDQTKELAEKCLSNDGKSFLEALGRLGFTDFYSSPLCLTLAAIEYRRNADSFPKTRGALYHVFVQQFLSEVRERRASAEIDEEMLDESLPVLRKLAVSMTLDRQLTSVASVLRTVAEHISGALDISLKRALQPSRSDKFLRFLGRRSGLLSILGESVGWSHNSFREYLAAVDIVEAGTQSKPAQEIIGRPSDPSYREIIKFILDIADQETEQFVTEILETTDEQEANAGLALVVNSLTRNTPISNTLVETCLRKMNHLAKTEVSHGLCGALFTLSAMNSRDMFRAITRLGDRLSSDFRKCLLDEWISAFAIAMREYRLADTPAGVDWIAELSPRPSLEIVYNDYDVPSWIRYWAGWYSGDMEVSELSGLRDQVLSDYAEEPDKIALSLSGEDVTELLDRSVEPSERLVDLLAKRAAKSDANSDWIVDKVQDAATDFRLRASLLNALCAGSENTQAWLDFLLSLLIDNVEQTDFSYPPVGESIDLLASDSDLFEKLLDQLKAAREPDIFYWQAVAKAFGGRVMALADLVLALGDNQNAKIAILSFLGEQFGHAFVHQNWMDDDTVVALLSMSSGLIEEATQEQALGLTLLTASLQLHRNEIQNALSSLTEHEGIGEDNVLYQSLLGYAYFRSDDNNSALVKLRHAKEIRGYLPADYFKVALMNLLVQEMELEQAAALYGQIDPNDPSPLFLTSLARLLYYSNPVSALAEVAALLDRALDLMPDYQYAISGRLSVCWRTGDLEKALKDAEHLHAEGLSEGLFSLALIKAEHGGDDTFDPSGPYLKDDLTAAWLKLVDLMSALGGARVDDVYACLSELFELERALQDWFEVFPTTRLAHYLTGTIDHSALARPASKSAQYRTYLIEQTLPVLESIKRLALKDERLRELASRADIALLNLCEYLSLSTQEAAVPIAPKRRFSAIYCQRQSIAGCEQEQTVAEEIVATTRPMGNCVVLIELEGSDFVYGYCNFKRNSTDRYNFKFVESWLLLKAKNLILIAQDFRVETILTPSTSIAENVQALVKWKSLPVVIEHVRLPNQIE